MERKKDLHCGRYFDPRKFVDWGELMALRVGSVASLGVGRFWPLVCAVGDFF